MHLCLFEDTAADHLAPITRTRLLSDVRPGLRTLGEIARDAFAGDTDGSVTLAVRADLADVAAEAHPDARIVVRTDTAAPLAAADAPTVFVSSAYVAHDGPILDRLRAAVAAREAVALWQDGSLVAAVAPDGEVPDELPRVDVSGARMVTRLWHLAPHVRTFIAADVAARFGDAPATREGADVHPAAILVAPEGIHMAPGSRIRAGAIVSAEKGPVVLERGAEIMEGAVVRGPIVLGRDAHVKPLASVEGTSLGPDSRVGGEIHTSIFQEHSNKGHQGFLGHSFIGAWCNIGASTDTSNLRNDYRDVPLYDAVAGDFVETGEQFLGLVLGDHVKCSIGTKFNTGTVVGVGCNLYDAGFHDRHVPDFSWGTPGAYVPFRFDTFERIATSVLARRDRRMTAAERALLVRIADAR